ncbi:MAG: DNA gyrase inhibitor YacG [Rhodobacteraceae bacterium]|nr:DNA gyrase inhibitor YacG [Paracoccaceae bacterium]
MTCPICAKAIDPKYRPFCSRRCADVDLGRWLTESYAIPVPEADQDAPPGDHEADDPSER